MPGLGSANLAADPPLSLRVRVDAALEGDGTLQGTTGLGVLDDLVRLLATASVTDVRVEVAGEAGEAARARLVGQAIGTALEEAAPLRARFGSSSVPSREALAHVAVDRGAGPYLSLNVDLTGTALGGLHADVLGELWRGLCAGGGWTLHARLLAGREPEHIVAAVTTALGHALRRSWATTT